MKSILWKFLLLSSVFVFLFVSCKKEKTEEPPVENIPVVTGNSTLLCGTVTDRNGNPLADVHVTAGTSSTTTNSFGYYAFNNFPCGDRCYVRCEKNGFFDGSRGVITQAGDITQANMKMIESAANFSVDASTNQGLLLPNGTGVLLSPNTVASANGSLYSGMMHVSVVHLDPTSADFTETTPGGDLIGQDLNGQTNQLYSYGMIMVEMTDDAGNELNLLPGATANIVIDVPASMLGNAPSNIPLWHYNEATGIWIEEGQATLNGDVYYGTVSHFSTWNCDYPGARSTIRGRVLDCNNNPVEGVSVQIGQGTAITNSNGYYERYVPANTSFSVQVNQPQLGLISESLNVTSADVGGELNASEVHVACPAYVTMTITCNAGGPIFGFASLTTGSDAFNIPLNSTGITKIAVPPSGASAELNIVGSMSGISHNVNVTLPTSAGQTVDAGTFDICGNGSNQGTLNTHFTIDGDGHNNETISYMSMPMTAFVVYSPADDNCVGFSVGNNQSVSFGFPGNGTGSWNSADESDAIVSITLGGDTWVMETGNITISQFGNVGSTVIGSFSGSFFRFDGTGLVYANITNGYIETTRNPDQQ